MVLQEGAAAMSAEAQRAFQSTPRDRECRSTPTRLARWTTAASLISSLGVCAACCLLPFVLISLGVTGAWVGTLDRLARFKWFFVIATMAFLGYGFYVPYFNVSAPVQAARNAERVRRAH